MPFSLRKNLINSINTKSGYNKSGYNKRWLAVTMKSTLPAWRDNPKTLSQAVSKLVGSTFKQCSRNSIRPLDLDEFNPASSPTTSSSVIASVVIALGMD